MCVCVCARVKLSEQKGERKEDQKQGSKMLIQVSIQMMPKMTKHVYFIHLSKLYTYTAPNDISLVKAKSKV